ncbi:IS701 family transposase [Streptomyces sp. NPDC127098]|uniref:IS701 family transposase n=1 Tax=Streptomyces sp. NPDC127098 TaxID=3347137 RepID=UPI0036577111
MLTNDVVPRIARDPISSYASEVFHAIPRVDQRRWAEVYLRGLLSVPGKKSVRKIAESILATPAHQSLQQFINQSPWRWSPVRAVLARYVQSVSPARAWVLSRVVIPKRGDRSVGVGRQFLPEAGRLVNCQIGLAASFVTDDASVPVNWRILLPKAWEGSEIRESAGIPDHVETRPQWLEAADMVWEMAHRWALSPAPVVADTRHLGSADGLIAELATHDGLPFVLEVDHALAEAAGADRLPRPRQQANLPLRPLESVLTAGRGLTALAGHRRHTVPPATPAARHTFVRSSLAKIPMPGGAPPRIARLLTEMSPDGEPARFWVTNLMSHRVDDVMALARLEGRARDGIQKLDRHFGLRDFEGRSFRGWHHHMTMVSAASVFAHVGWDALAACAC